MTKQVILVDDDPDDLEFMHEALNRMGSGYHCHSFHSAEQAIDFLKANSASLPDYIFLDINMPGMNGIECLQLIRRFREFDKVSIVMLSTSMPAHQAKTLVRLGADFTFEKPVSLEAYVTNLSKVFAS